MEDIKFQKPFLKWVGGKTQIINFIINKFPKEMNNYHEPFLGGGSVLLALLTLKKNNRIKINGKIYAYDLNRNLINLFNDVKNNKDKLFFHLTKYIKEYNNIKGSFINRKPKNLEEALTSKESYYYFIRDKYNNIKLSGDTTETSALFLFLNKTCFRGLYREGPNGFNVPYGHYKTTPSFLNLEDLNNISDLIKDTNFICQDFKTSIKNIKKSDFVYFDPPYVPENVKSFTKYTVSDFDLDTHKYFFNEILKFKKDVKFLMSNSKSDLVKEYFKDYMCEQIIVRRAINSKNPESKTLEIIIYN